MYGRTLLLASAVIVGTVTAAYADMTGHYVGTGDAEGTNLDLVQTGTSLSGTLSGADVGTLSGKVSGDTATGTLNLPNVAVVDFRLAWTAAGIEFTLVGPGGTQGFHFQAAGAGQNQNGPAATDVVYYVGIDGQPVGPLTLEELEARIVAGDVDADNLVWKTGAADWAAANTYPELEEALTPAPPPGPPPLPPESGNPPPLPPETLDSVSPGESPVAEALRDVVVQFVDANAPEDAPGDAKAGLVACIMTELEVLTPQDMQMLVDTDFQPADADVDRFETQYPEMMDGLDACMDAAEESLRAGGTNRTEVGFNGHTIIVEGGGDQTVESTPDGQRIVVGEHDILVTADRLTIDDESAPLPADYTELMVVVNDDGTFTVTIDGMELQPEP